MREEYVTMYARLVNAAANGAKGVVLTGQPGIGECSAGPSSGLLRRTLLEL